MKGGFMASPLLTLDTRNGVTVVRVNEKKLFQRAAQAFRSDMLGLLEQGHRLLLLDLSLVAVMNSSALGVVILSYDRMNREDGKFVLCGLSPILEEVFVRMHLNELFPVVRTEDEGISLLTGAAGAKNIPAK
jgi:anti-sigma B factor antagonist